MNKKYIGNDFDDFLGDEKLLDKVEAVAVKRVIVFQIEREMKRRQLTKTAKTSRAGLERLLDSTNTSITLSTLERAALALGKKLRVELA